MEEHSTLTAGVRKKGRKPGSIPRPAPEILADLESQLQKLTARYEEKSKKLHSRISKLRQKTQLDDLIKNSSDVNYDEMSEDQLRLHVRALSEILSKRKA